MQNTALRVGVTNEQFADQVRDWNLKVAEAATGGGELVSIFEEYEKELKNVNQEQLYGVEGMESITKALLDNGVSAEQTRSVLDRMASDLDKMLPILDGTTKGVNDFNYALTEVDQANIAKMASSFDYMKDNVVDVAGSVVADFAPAIWQVFDASVALSIQSVRSTMSMPSQHD
ncbi:hypothetical protein AT251_15585 [Enterovibrio nigricans]|nr:hypothetical protein [Enterovibrio nigricans]PKF49870.1 hypothetical protein AT251_15585 [Enterovibrio nigricans]